MNDRLGDLESWATDDDSSDGRLGGDVEIGAVGASSNDKSTMHHFFQQVDFIKADIDAIKKATMAINGLPERALGAPRRASKGSSSGKLRALTDQTNQQARHVKELLGSLKQETEKLKAQSSSRQSDMRIRENLCNSLTQQFVEQMKAYQAAQLQYKTAVREGLARQVKIVQQDATEEEIDAVMRSEGGLDALYQKHILAGTVNDKVKRTFIDVNSRYQDIVALEESMAQVHQMFIDLSLLVEHQGEQLNCIELQLEKATDEIDKGNEELAGGIERRRKRRRRQGWTALIVSGIVAFLFLLLL